ncbi:MAG: GNAT family N-acetyltransferase [Hyphomicrobiales bacterium]|nr:GNAT family N-acetyltransferase [Hyphomicrobiales bacterium]MCP5001381.1 GNAT family N-acetyltransferase [Hyphomicrobiales bacterium]
MSDNSAQTGLSDCTYMMRPMGIDDISTMTRWFSNFEDIALFDRNLPVPIGKEAVEASWKSAMEFSDPPRSLWYLAEDVDGDPVGLGGLQTINYIHGDAILPIFVARKTRTNGLATAITTILLDLAFKQLRLHRVSTYYRADHAASAHVTKKLGFQEEGRVRQGWFADGEYIDVVQVGILDSEWSALRDGLKKDLTVRSPITITLGEHAA